MPQRIRPHRRLGDAPGQIDAQVAVMRGRRPRLSLQVTINQLTYAAGKRDDNVLSVGRGARLESCATAGILNGTCSRRFTIGD
jgi:hypothetical protein